MPRSPVLVAAASLVAAMATGATAATAINTGGETGAYHRDFCPPLAKALEEAQFDPQCRASAGSVDNIARVAADPGQIGFAQFDIYALETAKMAGAPLTIIRSDMARECLFLVTKNKTFRTYGEVAALAPDLTFVLPPKDSGSSATFRFLQRIDASGLGQAAHIRYAASTEDAINEVLDGDDNLVTLFVQVPDPDNERFKTVDAKDGQFIPVISRAILRQEVHGAKVYYAQETDISNPKFLEKGETVVTTCTPVTLFTGSPDRLADGEARANQEDLIRTVKALDRDALLPSKGFFSALWKRTKELSAAGAEKAIELSEQAREKAAPYYQRAKEKARELMDGGEQPKP